MCTMLTGVLRRYVRCGCILFRESYETTRRPWCGVKLKPMAVKGELKLELAELRRHYCEEKVGELPEEFQTSQARTQLCRALIHKYPAEHSELAALRRSDSLGPCLFEGPGCVCSGTYTVSCPLF